jgi:hypothetical protein
VERHENGEAVVAVHRGKQIHHAARGRGVKRCDRLVGDEKLGALHQRAGDRGALLLAARELTCALEGMLLDADACQRLHRLELFDQGESPDRAVQNRHPAKQPKADVGQQRQPRNQIELLKDDPDTHAEPAAAIDPAAFLDRVSHDDDPAGLVRRFASWPSVDRRQTGQCADQGGFAGARCADQRDHFAAADGQAEIVEDAYSAEGLRRISYVDYRLRLHVLTPIRR